METIYEAFLWKEERTASLTGIIEIYSNEYEVEQFLCGKKVTVRFDPYDLAKGVKIYYDGKQYHDAVIASCIATVKKGLNKRR